MQAKHASFGPIALGSSAANILNPGSVTGGVNCIDANYNSVRIWLKRIRICNKDTVDRAVSFWIGATGASAAGTEFLGTAMAIAPNTGIEFQCDRMLDKTDFLVGMADVAAKCTIEGDTEVSIA